MPLSPIEKSLLALLLDVGSIRGTAQVGYALWPDRRMQPQGAALAAGKVLRGLRDRGLVSSSTDQVLSVYAATVNGRKALNDCKKMESNLPQQSLLIE